MAVTAMIDGVRLRRVKISTVVFNTMERYQRGFAIEAILGVIAILTILGGATYVAKEERLTPPANDATATTTELATTSIAVPSADASTTIEATVDVSL